MFASASAQTVGGHRDVDHRHARDVTASTAFGCGAVPETSNVNAPRAGVLANSVTCRAGCARPACASGRRRRHTWCSTPRGGGRAESSVVAALLAALLLIAAGHGMGGVADLRRPTPRRDCSAAAARVLRDRLGGPRATERAARRVSAGWQVTVDGTPALFVKQLESEARPPAHGDHAAGVRRRCRRRRRATTTRMGSGPVRPLDRLDHRCAAPGRGSSHLLGHAARSQAAVRHRRRVA